MEGGRDKGGDCNMSKYTRGINEKKVKMEIEKQRKDNKMRETMLKGIMGENVRKNEVEKQKNKM